jgi:hypothetical protein
VVLGIYYLQAQEILLATWFTPNAAWHIISSPRCHKANNSDTCCNSKQQIEAQRLDGTTDLIDHYACFLACLVTLPSNLDAFVYLGGTAGIALVQCCLIIMEFAVQ